MWMLLVIWQYFLKELRLLIIFLNDRLQREEEEAYANTQHTHGAQSLTFTKFEEKKTSEKLRKVATVKKFFGASSRPGTKKGKVDKRNERELFAS